MQTQMSEGAVNCPVCHRNYDRLLNAQIPYLGSNQFSPFLDWNGNRVTVNQYKILTNLRKTTEERIAQGLDDGLRHDHQTMIRRVWGYNPVILDPHHALRQQIYRMRHQLKLKGWRIDANRKGYILVRQEEGTN